MLVGAHKCSACRSLHTAVYLQVRCVFSMIYIILTRMGSASINYVSHIVRLDIGYKFSTLLPRARKARQPSSNARACMRLGAHVSTNLPAGAGPAAHSHLAWVSCVTLRTSILRPSPSLAPARPAG